MIILVKVVKLCYEVNITIMASNRKGLNMFVLCHYNSILLNVKCDNKDDFQQIQLMSTENCYHLLTNLQEDLGSVDAVATSQAAANKDPVKEPSIPLLATTMTVMT